MAKGPKAITVRVPRELYELFEEAKTIMRASSDTDGVLAALKLYIQYAATSEEPVQQILESKKRLTEFVASLDAAK